MASLQPGDVMVVSRCQGSYWGELLATASEMRGSVGIVADAHTRDARRLVEMGFPTFVSAISPQDSLGRVDVVASGQPVLCGGVKVENGDLIIANCDGIAVIPEEVAVDVLELAEQKVVIEAEMRNALRSGVPIDRAFATYGVL